MEERLQIREPVYMEKFYCLGPECPDTCCQGWDVLIDGKTWQHYTACKDEKFRQMFAKFIIPNADARDDGEVPAARMRMEGKAYRCPFLCRDGLCLIQRRTSEENLSETCRTYPRVFHHWSDGQAEGALSISCIYAARLILFSGEPLRFQEREISSQALRGLRVVHEGETLAANSQPLRKMLITALQKTGKPLTERILGANHFFWQILPFLKRRSSRKFEQQAALFQRQKGGTGGRFSGKEKIQSRVAFEAIRQFLRIGLRGNVYPKFQENARYAVHRWKLSEQHPAGPAEWAVYQEDAAHYAPLFWQTYGQAMENYLVNQIFKDFFFSEESFAPVFLWCALLYSFVLMRLLILARMAEHGGVLSFSEIFPIIQGVSKAVHHDAVFLQQADERLEKMGLRSEQGMAAFLSL